MNYMLNFDLNQRFPGMYLPAKSTHLLRNIALIKPTVKTAAVSDSEMLPRSDRVRVIDNSAKLTGPS